MSIELCEPRPVRWLPLRNANASLIQVLFHSSRERASEIVVFFNAVRALHASHRSFIFVHADEPVFVRVPKELPQSWGGLIRPFGDVLAGIRRSTTLCCNISS